MPTMQMTEIIQHLRSAALLRDAVVLTDGQLLERFVTHRDQSALAVLVQRHGPMVWGVCRRLLRGHHDAEDAFQATFLVLVRRAAAVVPREMVANWLHGVARQTALKARVLAARRKTREGQVADMPEPAAQEQNPTSDLRLVLDEELSRLSDKYRIAIVLCDLEGTTGKEAARQLGVPEGTLSGRLRRGRALLAKRLAQRGVAVTSGTLAAALSHQAASACVPAVLVSSTIKATELFAAGQAALSAQVAALTEGMLKSMVVTKAKLVMVIVMGACLVLLSAGLAARQPQPTPIAQLPPIPGNKETPIPPSETPFQKDDKGDPLPHGTVARFGSARFRHGQYVRSVAYAPDGKEVASSSYDGTIRFWDPMTGRELRRFPKQFDSPGDVAYIAGGKELIVAEGTWHAPPGQVQFRGVRVWEVATGKLLRGLDQVGKRFDHRRFAITPGGDRIAFLGDGYGSVLILNPRNPNPADSVTIEVDDGHITHVALSADRRLAVGALLKVDGQPDREKRPSFVRVYDLQSGKQLWERKGITASAAGMFPAIDFSPDGKTTAVSFSHTEQMMLLDSTGALVRRFTSKTVGAWPFRFTADGTKLYMTGWGQSNEIWDVRSGNSLGPWSRGGGNVFALALSPDGKTMASAERRKIRMMVADSGESAVPDEGTSAEVDHIELHPDGRRLLAGGYRNEDAGFTIWDRHTGRRLFDYPKGAAAFSLAPDGKTVAVGFFDRSPVLFDLDAEKVLREMERKGTRVRWLTFSPDGGRIAHHGWFENMVHEIDPKTMVSRTLLELPKTTRPVALAMFPGGNRLALAVPGERDPDGQSPVNIEIWELAGKRMVRSLPGLIGGFPVLIAVSPDGRRVAAGSANTRFIYTGQDHDTRVLVWDAGTGEQLAALPGSVNGHRCVAFSPDGRTVAAGGEDHAAYLWELASGTLRSKLVGHEGPVTAVKFTPDGRTLYTGSSDTTVLAWNLVASPTEPVDPAAAWTDLRAVDGMKAHRAMRALLANPADSVAKVARHFKKIPPPDEAALRKLIIDLDSPDFGTREAASKELIRIGRGSLPFLQGAARTQSLEASLRANKLIRMLDPYPLTGDALQQVRAVELLERIATPDARRLLNDLAEGARGHLITEEAKAAMGRLREK